jgi:sodium-dependent dicarboxylate transporter 2/3/5
MIDATGKSTPKRLTFGQWGLWLGPIVGLLVYLLAPEADPGSAVSNGLSPAGRIVAGVGVWMAIWWLSEALPLAATALLPVAVLPILTGGTIGVRGAAVSYAHEMVLLFFGGFILGRAIEHVGLHRRIALSAIRLAGTRPHRLIAAFMLTGAFLSMWISNTATAVMMLPIALSVIHMIQPETDDPRPTQHTPFATALLLGVAYSTSIGGMGTLIGTPPNAQLAGFVTDQYGIRITFAQWLLIGLPLMVLLLPAAWWVLTHLAFRVENEPLSRAGQLLDEEIGKLGRMSASEWRVTGIFACTALAWITRQWLAQITIGGDWRPLVGLTDTGIAMLAGVAVFTLPGERGKPLMGWEQMRSIPWGVLLLFGGGLSLAKAAKDTGLADFVGMSVASWEGLSPFVLLAAMALVIVLLTEMTSNTATAAAFLPVIGGAAQGLQIAPLQMLVPATIAASCAFMMPVATPPNAVVFSSGAVTIRQMCKAGVWMNLISWGVLLLVSTALVPVVCSE